MHKKIRGFAESDRDTILGMMRTFYSSPAVLTNGSEEIFESDFNACISASPYIEGYVYEEMGEILAYSMIAKSFSTEYGRPCIWIEDLYVTRGHRGRGIGTALLEYIEKKYPDALLRLEAEAENERAIGVYRKFGFEVLPYTELKK